MQLSKNSKIFLAGHNGMVGSSILKVLKKKKYKNIITQKKNKLDLTNQKKTEDYLKKIKPDLVIIAAAKVGGILSNSTYPTEFLLDNLKIQNNLIENAWKSGVKRLLFLGSSCIYPKFAKQPISEESLLTDSLE